ncbi:MAG: polyprenol monophosphomannose synthase [Thermodesulfobacteriota bacterium]|jgi:dolichol-phosphate mannosyltransferase
MVSVSVILPTYNEADNIIPLIEEILTYIPLESEIIVVDDDSPDRTWEAVEAFGQKESRVRLLRRIGRKGLTSALQEGINWSKGRYIFWMDCDFSMPPDKIPVLLQALEDHDIAMASRYIPGGEEKGHSPLGSFLSRAICSLASRVLSPAIKDYTSGYIGLRREVIQTLPLKGDYGEYFIELIYKAYQKGYKIKEIPYRCLPRRSGESKTATDLWGYLKRGRKYLATIVRLRFGSV